VAEVHGAKPAAPQAPDRTEHGWYPDVDAGEVAHQHREAFGEASAGVEQVKDGETVVHTDMLREAHLAGRAATQALEVEGRKILADEDLPDAGKAKKIAAKAAEKAASLAEAERAVAEAEAERDRLAEKLRKDVESHTPETVEVMLAMERRKALLDLEPVERGQIVLEAIAKGDVETLRAVTSVPNYVAKLTQPTYERAQAALSAATHGKEIAALDTYAKRVGAARQSVDAARRFLTGQSSPEALAKAGVQVVSVKTMTDDEKSNFIAEKGLAAFRQLVAQS
jgi:hypothetical protein